MKNTNYYIKNIILSMFRRIFKQKLHPASSFGLRQVETSKTSNYKYNIIFSFFMLAAMLALPASSYAIGAIGVKPLTINLEVTPGITKKFQLHINSITEEPAKVKIIPMDMIQKEDGSGEFLEAGKSPFSCTKWIKMEKLNFTVPVGETITLNGEVKLPAGAKGSKVAIMMIIPDTPKLKKGVTVVIRYAVRIMVRTKNRVLEKIGIENVDFDISDGQPIIKAIINNQSKADIKTTGRLMLQDKNNKIIITMPLMSLTEETRKKEKEKNTGKKQKIEGTRIYPESTVAFLGRINKPLVPGEYKATIMLKYGDRKSFNLQKNITLTKELLAKAQHNQQGKNSFYEIKPASVALKAPPGSSRMATFNLQNKSENTLKAALNIRDIKYDLTGKILFPDKNTTAYSCSNWIELSDKEIEIAPRLSKSINIKLKAPPDTPAGGYYSQIAIDMAAVDAASDKTKINHASAMISVIIPGKTKIAGEIIKTEPVMNKSGIKSFNVLLANKGNIGITPQGSILIRDIYQNEVERIELKSNNSMILPHTKSKLQGTVKKKLIPGKYFA